MLRPGRSCTSRSRGSSTPNERAISPRPSISARRTFRPDESAAIARAAATVILQIDSKGGFGDEAVRLGRMIRSSSVPIIAWVGPSGAHAAGGALFLVYGSSLATMAPGAGLGPARPFDLATLASRERSDLVNERSATLAALADGAGARPGAVRQLVNGPALAAAPAQQLGAIALVAKDIPDLLRKLDGRTVSTNGGPVSLATASSPGRPVAIRFHELGPVRRVLHAV